MQHQLVTEEQVQAALLRLQDNSGIIKSKVLVEIIESEKGWGQKVDEVKEFQTLPDAVKFIDEYNNSYNAEESVPDWYMYARLK